MKRKSIVFLLVLVALGVGLRQLYKSLAPAKLPPPAWTLDQAIEEAAGYVVRVTDANGRFIYLMAPDGGVASPEYNIVRHAGAIYALADYETQASTPEAKARAAEATKRAATFMLSGYTKPLKDKPDTSAVWSDPKEEGGAKWSAKLGGSGLGMVGLLGRVRAGGEGASLAPAQDLARFVVFMQRPNGDFNSKYTETEGKILGESLYYPGEAILGLAMLYEQDKNPAWLDAGLLGVSARAAAIKGSTDIPADHWLMIAVDRLLPIAPDAKSSPVTRDEMLELAITIGRSMIKGQERARRKHPELDGCYTNDGRTTPSATRLEGLLALEHAIKDDPKYADVHKEVVASIVSGMAFLRRAQITSGPARGAFPPDVSGAAASASDEPGGDEGASRRRGEVRIDYVQHAASAMMRYRQFCAREPKLCSP